MKVAQHFSAGRMMQKTRPSRLGTIERLGSQSRMRLHEYKQPSIVPFLLRRPDYGGQAGTGRF